MSSHKRLRLCKPLQNSTNGVVKRCLIPKTELKQPITTIKENWMVKLCRLRSIETENFSTNVQIVIKNYTNTTKEPDFCKKADFVSVYQANDLIFYI